MAEHLGVDNFPPDMTLGPRNPTSYPPTGALAIPVLEADVFARRVIKRCGLGTYPPFVGRITTSGRDYFTSRDYARMRPALVPVYLEEIDRLEHMLDRDLSDWRRVDVTS